MSKESTQLITLKIVLVNPCDFPRECPRGYRVREIPRWCLGLDPGAITQQCYQHPDGSIIVSK